MTLVLVAGLAAGCGKSDDKDGGKPRRKMGLQTGQDCDRLGTKSVALAMKDTPPGMTEEQKVVLRKLAEEAGLALARHCKDDEWSGEAVACGMSATDPSKECDSKLTDGQKQKLRADVQAIFEKGMAAVMAAAPPPGAPTTTAGAGTAAPTPGSAEAAPPAPPEAAPPTTPPPATP